MVIVTIEKWSPAKNEMIGNVRVWLLTAGVENNISLNPRRS